MSIFVDTSIWFAAASARDHNNLRAISVLETFPDHITTDHVLVETWQLLKNRFRREIAERFWEQLRVSGVHVETVSSGDLEAAWTIGRLFPDQNFSIVDRTSFVVMERLGITRVASLDNDFFIYRYGRRKERAFEVVTSGHSHAFALFHKAILGRQTMTCTYKGLVREISPHILGHTQRKEKALVFQFGGRSSTTLPARGEWRCFDLAEVTDITLHETGRWHTGRQHTKTQRCVDRVYIDVNEAVPNQPGRR